MPEPLTPTELRSKLYRVLDEIAASGQSREIVRGESRFLIVPLDGIQRRKLWERPKRKALRSITADELVATSWDYEPDSSA